MQPQHDLELPRWIGSRDSRDRRQEGSKRRRTLAVDAVHADEIRMIEQVEGLDPRFRLDYAVQFESLCNRGVDIESPALP